MNNNTTLNKEINVIWQPNPGAQDLLLQCPIFEVLVEGNRSGGKSDALLMNFLQHVGKGYGAEWRGIIFRETYKNLEDIKIKSLKWFKQIFPKAIFNSSDYKWTFPKGEVLYFRYANRLDDYWNYHGHAYPFIGWEELTNWRTDELYLMMFSICRSSHPEIPKMIRSTCNPWGKGHFWVKKRFKITENQSCEVIEEKLENPNTKKEMIRERCYIHSSRSENKIFIDNDPEYEINLEQNKNPNIRKAWIEGSWDIVAGGMFDDVWDKEVHILPRINIPNTWYIDRSFDYGQSKPFSVGYWAMTDGSPISIIYKIKQLDGSYIEKLAQKTFPKGTLIRFWEWYGCQPNLENKGLRLTSKEIGRGIQKIEQHIKKAFNIIKINPGPGDSSIFDADHKNDSIAELLNEGYGNTRTNHIFVKADKSPGSRKRRWEKMRTMFKDALKFPMEDPGLFVTEDCKAFIRTVPILGRDDKDPDDINCFIAGTKVQTEKELKNIEDVTKKDLVYTPIGLCKVKKSICSGMSKTIKVTFSNGESLEGTPNHKIHVPGKGLIALKDLKINSTLEKVQWNKSKSMLAYKLNINYLSVFATIPFILFSSYLDKDILLNKKNKKVARNEIIEIIEKIRIVNISKEYKDNITDDFFKLYSDKCYNVSIKNISITSIENIKDKKTVYNLVTEKAGLYYANNILVSNTDEEDHCFTGDTKVITTKGKIAIKDLVNTKGKVLTDSGYQKYRNCRLVGENKKVIKLYFSDGMRIKCTPDHLFYTGQKWIRADAIRIKEDKFFLVKLKKNKQNLVHLIKRESISNEDVYCLTVPTHERFCIEHGIVVSNCADESGYRLLHRPMIQKSIKHSVG